MSDPACHPQAGHTYCKITASVPEEGERRGNAYPHSWKMEKLDPYHIL